MTDSIDIHTLWRVYDDIVKKKGKISIVHDRGLVSVFGPDRAIRELKRRCDNELQKAGRPLRGCSLYVGYLYALTDLNTTYEISNEHSSRYDRNERMRMVGEDEIVELIESTWAEHKGADKLPKGAVLDVFEEFDEIIEEKYGAVKAEGAFIDKEIELSKDLALILGKRKRRERREKPAAPEPEEPREESEPEPEPVHHEPTVPDIRAMIEERIKSGG